MTTINFSQLLPMVKIDFKTGSTPIIIGEPGIGKSKFFESLAKELKTKVFTLSVNQLADRADLTGNRIVEVEHNGQKQWEQSFFPHATLMQAIRYANDHPDEQPIIFLDEINRTSADITSAILSFTTSRSIGTLTFPDNIVFAVAGNDKGNVVTLDSASMTRFSKYTVNPDLNTFLTVSEQNTFIKQALTKNPDYLVLDPEQTISADSDDDVDYSFGLDTTSEFSQLTRPRTIEQLAKWLNAAHIDGSKSQEEFQALTDLIQLSDDNETSLLEVAIVSKIGNTLLANALLEIIDQHYNTLLGGNIVTPKAVTDILRPEQTTINALSRATSSTDIDQLLNAMTPEHATNLMIWLLDEEPRKEVNNNNAVQQVIARVKDVDTKVTPKQTTVLNQLITSIASAGQTDTQYIKLFQTGTSSLANTWTPIIDTLLVD